MKKQIYIIIAVVVATLTQLSAQEYDYFLLDDISEASHGRNIIPVVESETDDADNIFDHLPRKARVRKITRSDVKFKDVTVSQAGTLESLLGDDINDIDSLVVRGPINEEDFHTLWSSSFYGVLTVANLEYAQIVGNRIPKEAFWNSAVQYPMGSEIIECIPLRRIILPEGVVEIGEDAFSYAIKLIDINFTSSLKSIKKRCFMNCISLNFNPLVLPEGFEEIGAAAFAECKLLTGKVILPSTLKKIDGSAFYSTKITECNFPEGLEEIGGGAFSRTRLKEAILPNSCHSFPGAEHFAYNYVLEKVRFPEGATLIPGGFVQECQELTEFIMPNSIVEIGDRAFFYCEKLQELKLSSNLKSIGESGLSCCRRLKTISFPPTLETLGERSCLYWINIENIYCAAKTPPVCLDNKSDPDYSPFGKYGLVSPNQAPMDTPVYVPFGSADLYRNAWGWDYFTNFIETDNFPSSGIDSFVIDGKEDSGDYYDLSGRKVEVPIPGTIYIRNGKKCIIR